jgi:DNA-binding NarL/FixJ family response regulator
MLSVLAFTDEVIVAAGLKQVLNRKSGFGLVGVSDRPSNLVEMALSLKPDLMLLDLTPELTFGVLYELGERAPDHRIVLWVRSISTELALQAIENGVRGIVRKTLPEETLLKCLRMVADGGLWFEESLKEGFLASRTINLSKRESQLVALLSQGLRNKEIASLLLISEGSVKVYLSRLFRKLGVNDRFELALFGLRNLPLAEIVSDARLGGDGASTGAKDVSRPEWLRSLVLNRPSERVRA